VHPLEVGGLVAAGVAAGTINTIVGSGTLITFPVLLAFGYSPVVANVSNTIGLVPGSFTGVHGYRRELEGQRRRVVRYGATSLLGGVTGGLLLLVLPASAFRAIVPVLIALAVALVACQPLVRRALAGRRPAGRDARGLPVVLAVFGCAVYGGYFGAAQGIVFLAIFGLALHDDLQRVNALKNVLALLVNLVAGVLFALLAPVAWGPAALLAAGSAVGGRAGAHIGRRLPPAVLRGVIAAVGAVAIARLVFG
jgi:uncharacterized membrane protein YfcA